MATAGGIRAGRATVEIGATIEPLRKALALANNAVSSFGKGLVGAASGFASGIGTAFSAAKTIGTQLYSAANAFAEAGSTLYDAAGRTGASVEFLSQLDYAAQQTGTNLSTVETGFKRMAKVVTDAASGSQQAASVLGGLGLTLSDLSGLSPDEQFKKLAGAISTIEDPTTRAGAALDVFGKSGTQLLPLISDLDTLSASADRLGLTMTGDTAAAADVIGDAFTDVNMTAKRLFVTFSEALAPAALAAADTLSSSFATAMQWVKANGETISATVFSVAAYVMESAQTISESLYSAWVPIREFVAPALTFFKGIVEEAMGVAIAAYKNAGLAADLFAVGTAYRVVQVGNIIEHTFTVQIPAWLGWLGQNWREVFYDILNVTEAVIGNMWTNLTNFFDAIMSYLSGDGFDFQWTGLLKGFTSTLREMPKIVEREIGPIESSLGERFQELTRQFSEGIVAGKSEVPAIQAEIAEPYRQLALRGKEESEKAKRQLEEQIAVVGARDKPGDLEDMDRPDRPDRSASDARSRIESLSGFSASALASQVETAFAAMSVARNAIADAGQQAGFANGAEPLVDQNSGLALVRQIANDVRKLERRDPAQVL